MNKVTFIGGILYDLIRVIKYKVLNVFSPYPYRKYLKNKKCIFIHVPKAAGTSVLKALGHNGQRDHATYREFLRTDYFKFQNYFKFSIVRDPFSRFLSLYIYFLNGGNKSKQDMSVKEMIEDNSMSINEFCKYVYDHQWYIINPMFWPQTIYICDENLNVMVDTVIKLENINEEFDVIKNKLALKNDISIVNKSDRKDIVNCDYDEESKKIIYKIYKTDFLVFKY